MNGLKGPPKGKANPRYYSEIMICDFSKGLELVSGLDIVPGGGGRRFPRPFGASDVDPELRTMAVGVERDKAAPEEAMPYPEFDGSLSRRDEGGLFSPSYQPNPSPTRQPALAPPYPWPPGPPGPLPPSLPPPGWVGSLRPIRSLFFEAVLAGKWHDLPGLSTSVKLDFSRLVTFFDPRFESLVIARRSQTRGTYRVGNITRDEAAIMRRDLEESLLEKGPDQRKASGVDWTAITQAVVERHAGRFEYLLLLLEDAAGPSSNTRLKVNLTETVTRIRWQVLTMLTPYMLATSVPPSPPHRAHNETAWLAPTVQY